MKMFLLLLEETDWDYSRKEILGYSENEEKLDSIFSKFYNIRNYFNRIISRFYEIKEELDSKTDEIIKPTYKEKENVQGLKLTPEQMEERRLINEYNRQEEEKYRNLDRERIKNIERKAIDLIKDKFKNSDDIFVINLLEYKILRNEIKIENPIPQIKHLDDYWGRCDLNIQEVKEI